ncbi:MAG: EAL domain-containing protein [Pseudomonadota bacterium]
MAGKEGYSVGNQRVRIGRWSWILVALWTAVLAGSYVSNAHQIQSLQLEQASSELSANALKNQVFRMWATSHGGIYVPVTETQRPDPYISSLPERDVVTPSGRVLTLISPALMMRQFNELAKEKFDIDGHISGIKPINPLNTADTWEQRAYQQFSLGKKEVSAITTRGGQSYLRLMHPAYMKAPCLKCHAVQGFQEGDLGGGYSVSINLGPIEKITEERMSALRDGHLIIWVLGLAGILFGKYLLAKQINHREQAQAKIKHDYNSQQLISGVLKTSLKPISFEQRLERMLQQIIEMPWLQLQAKGAVFITGSSDELEMVAQHGMSMEALNTCASIKLGECLCGQVAQRGKLIYKACIDDGHEHRFCGMEEHGHYGLPIHGSDRLLGVINLYIAHNHPRSEDEIALLTTVSNTIGTMIQRHQAEQTLLHNAYYDDLTNMPNRPRFLQQLNQRMMRLERNPGSKFAVLFLDLDRFKVINDSLGHTVGDKLLVEVAKRLKESIRPEDSVARLGGDEFTILLEDISSENEVSEIAERIYTIMRDPYDVETSELYAPSSIGITFSNPRYQTPEEMLRDANIAMYRAKGLDGGHCVFFDQAMHISAIKRHSMESELLRAFENNELKVYYQPIISSQSGRITGVEALVRWPRPDGTMVPPDEFIPLAEETSLINDIGLWVLREACRQMQVWHSTLPQYGDLYVSINLSGKQLMQANLFELIETILLGINYKPEKLRLEITESTLINESVSNVLLLQKFRDHEYRFYIDDFGTGYSSLSYLHNFPFDALKIDRSFVSKLQNGDGHRKMVETIISIAHNFNMKVVAEGIETQQQRDQLRSMGCEYLQGFLFSRPLPADELTALLIHQKQLTIT